MLGRATRAVEMTRGYNEKLSRKSKFFSGGKEGNNAFLNYEASPARINEIHDLVESGMTYSNMIAIIKTKEAREYSVFLNYEKGINNRGIQRFYLEIFKAEVLFLKN